MKLSVEQVDIRISLDEDSVSLNGFNVRTGQLITQFSWPILVPQDCVKAIKAEPWDES